MPDNIGWLFRPMEAGYCTYLDIKRGRVSLYDIAVMNDVLDVKNENDWRLSDEAAKPKR